MSKKNDSLILKLKKTIAAKKKKIAASGTFNPITNCFFELDGYAYNIRTIDKQLVTLLYAKVHNIYTAAAEIGILSDCMISGFNVEDWLRDFNNLYNHMSIREEQTKLNVMEKRLEKLLSSDKKVELELDKIKGMLDDE